MQPLRKVISKLKLRASYGQVGNANLGGRRLHTSLQLPMTMRH